MNRAPPSNKRPVSATFCRSPLPRYWLATTAPPVHKAPSTAVIRKLMVSTNVCGRKLAATDYKFHYTLEESFRDWFEDCDRKELV